MRQCFSRVVATVASLALAAAAVPLFARTAAAGDDATSVVTPALPEALLAQLLLLSDDASEVLYVPGTLDRAAHVELWLRSLAVGAAKRTRHPARIVGVVLGHDEWQQARLPCPYGVPCRAGVRVVALPAAGDAGTVVLWQGLIGTLPQLGGTPLMGTVEEAASLAPADAYASLVASRDLVAAAGFLGDEPWIVDVLAHAVSLDAARQSRTGRDIDLDGFWEGVRRRYGPQGMEPADALAGELRQQAKLYFAAQTLLAGEGKFPERALRKLQEKGGGRLRAADLRAAWPNALAGL